MFEQNEGSFDRVVRGVLGAVLIAAGALLFGGYAGSWLSLTVASWVGVVVGIIGALALLTGITGFCVLYRLFHIETTHGTTGAV